MANERLSAVLRITADGSAVGPALDAIRGRAEARPLSLSVVIKGADAAVRDVLKVQESMTAVANKATAATADVRSLTAAIRAGGSAAEEFGHQVGLAARRFGAFTAATAGWFAAVRGIRDAASEMVAFDTALNKLEQVADESRQKVVGLTNSVLDMAGALGVSSRELMGVATTFKQAGLSIDDTRKAVAALAATALAPNFDSMKQTAEGAVAAFQQFGKSADKLSDQLGAMNSVAGGFAVEAADLVTATQRAGGAFSALGGELNELLGLFTSIRATTRESAESIATGMRTIFARLQRSDTVDALKGLGVSLRYGADEVRALRNSGIDVVQEQFVGAFEAVKRLSAALGQMSEADPRFSAVIEQLGGYRQISRVIPLLKEFGEAQKAVNVARVGGVSLEVNQEQAQRRLEVRLTKVREQYVKLFDEMSQTSGFQRLAMSLETVAGGFAKILDVAGRLAPLLAGLGIGYVAKSAAGFVRGTTDGISGRVATPHLAAAAPPPVFRRAAGGGIPAAGRTLLESGEQVVPAQAARAIGHDVLRRWNAEGVPPHFVGGGTVPGGYGGGDRVPATLEPGSFVIRKEAVRAAGGAEGVRRAAAGGRTPRYAQGGFHRMRDGRRVAASVFGIPVQSGDHSIAVDDARFIEERFAADVAGRPYSKLLHPRIGLGVRSVVIAPNPHNPVSSRRQGALDWGVDDDAWMEYARPGMWSLHRGGYGRSSIAMTAATRELYLPESLPGKPLAAAEEETLRKRPGLSRSATIRVGEATWLTDMGRPWGYDVAARRLMFPRRPVTLTKETDDPRKLEIISLAEKGDSATLKKLALMLDEQELLRTTHGDVLTTAERKFIRRARRIIGGKIRGVSNQQVYGDRELANLIARKRAFGFQQGGGVPCYGEGGAVSPALLEPGEFVLTPREARAIGYDRLAWLNAAGATGRVPRRSAGTPAVPPPWWGHPEDNLGFLFGGDFTPKIKGQADPAAPNRSVLSAVSAADMLRRLAASPLEGVGEQPWAAALAELERRFAPTYRDESNPAKVAGAKKVRGSGLVRGVNWKPLLAAFGGHAFDAFSDATASLTVGRAMAGGAQLSDQERFELAKQSARTVGGRGHKLDIASAIGTAWDMPLAALISEGDNRKRPRNLNLLGENVNNPEWLRGFAATTVANNMVRIEAAKAVRRGTITTASTERDRSLVGNLENATSGLISVQPTLPNEVGGSDTIAERLAELRAHEEAKRDAEQRRIAHEVAEAERRAAELGLAEAKKREMEKLRAERTELAQKEGVESELVKLDPELLKRKESASKAAPTQRGRELIERLRSKAGGVSPPSPPSPPAPPVTPTKPVKPASPASPRYSLTDLLVGRVGDDDFGGVGPKLFHGGARKSAAEERALLLGQFREGLAPFRQKVGELMGVEPERILPLRGIAGGILYSSPRDLPKRLRREIGENPPRYFTSSSYRPAAVSGGRLLTMNADSVAIDSPGAFSGVAGIGMMDQLLRFGDREQVKKIIGHLQNDYKKREIDETGVGSMALDLWGSVSGNDFVRGTKGPVQQLLKSMVVDGRRMRRAAPAATPPVDNLETLPYQPGSYGGGPGGAGPAGVEPWSGLPAFSSGPLATIPPDYYAHLRAAAKGGRPPIPLGMGALPYQAGSYGGGGVAPTTMFGGVPAAFGTVPPVGPLRPNSGLVELDPFRNYRVDAARAASAARAAASTLTEVAGAAVTTAAASPPVRTGLLGTIRRFGQQLLDTYGGTISDVLAGTAGGAGGGGRRPPAPPMPPSGGGEPPPDDFFGRPWRPSEPLENFRRKAEEPPPPPNGWSGFLGRFDGSRYAAPDVSFDPLGDVISTRAGNTAAGNTAAGNTAPVSPLVRARWLSAVRRFGQTMLNNYGGKISDVPASAGGRRKPPPAPPAPPPPPPGRDTGPVVGLTAAMLAASSIDLKEVTGLGDPPAPVPREKMLAASKTERRLRAERELRLRAEAAAAVIQEENAARAAQAAHEEALRVEQERTGAMQAEAIRRERIARLVKKYPVDTPKTQRLDSLLRWVMDHHRLDNGRTEPYLHPLDPKRTKPREIGGPFEVDYQGLSVPDYQKFYFAKSAQTGLGISKILRDEAGTPFGPRRRSAAVARWDMPESLELQAEQQVLAQEAARAAVADRRLARMVREEGRAGERFPVVDARVRPSDPDGYHYTKLPGPLTDAGATARLTPAVAFERLIRDHEQARLDEAKRLRGRRQFEAGWEQPDPALRRGLSREELVLIGESLPKYPGWPAAPGMAGMPADRAEKWREGNASNRFYRPTVPGYGVSFHLAMHPDRETVPAAAYAAAGTVDRGKVRGNEGKLRANSFTPPTTRYDDGVRFPVHSSGNSERSVGLGPTESWNVHWADDYAPNLVPWHAVKTVRRYDPIFESTLRAEGLHALEAEAADNANLSGVVGPRRGPTTPMGPVQDWMRKRKVGRDKDGKPVFEAVSGPTWLPQATTYGFRDHVNDLARDSVSRDGGTSATSSHTNAPVAFDENGRMLRPGAAAARSLSAASKELDAALRKQLRSIGVSSREARLLAAELTQAAVAANAELQRDAGGHIAGLTATGLRQTGRDDIAARLEMRTAAGAVRDNSWHGRFDRWTGAAPGGRERLKMVETYFAHPAHMTEDDWDRWDRMRDMGLVSSARVMGGAAFEAAGAAVGVGRRALGAVGRGVKWASDTKVGRWFGGGSASEGERAAASNRTLAFGAGASVAGSMLTYGDAAVRGVAEGKEDAGVYRATEGAGGALQGAAMGAGVGMAFGGLAVPVFAIVGAAVGIANAMREANAKIRQAAVAISVDHLANEYAAVAGGRKKFEEIDPREFGGAVDRLRSTARESAESSRSYLWGLYQGKDPELNAAAYKREIRLAAGPQVTNLYGGVATAAEKIGRDLGSDTQVAAGQDKLREAAEGRLRNSEVVGKSLELLVDLGVYKSAAQGLRELADAAVKAAVATRTQNELEKQNRANERAAASLSRLADSANAAAQAAAPFGRAAATVLSLSGGGSPPPLADLGQLFQHVGGNNPAAAQQLYDVLGGVPGGGRFAATLRGADEVAGVLPAVLGQAMRNAKPSDLNPQAAVQLLLERQLGSRYEDADVKRAAQTAMAELGELISKENGSLAKAVGADPGEFAQRLLGKLLEPASRSGARLIQTLGGNELEQSGGMAAALRLRETAADQRAAAVSNDLAALRAGAELPRDGRRAVDRLSVEQLDAPRRAQLAALTGGDNATAGGIAARLASLRGEAARLSGEREATRPNPEKWREVEQKFQGVISESARLTRALALMGDATQRVASLQEKRAAADESAASRRSYAEKFIFAEPEERARMHRQAMEALNATPETFAAMPTFRQRDALAALSDLGGANLPDGTNAAVKKQQLLDALLPGGLQGKELGESDKMKAAIEGAFKEAAAAQRAAAEATAAAEADFLSKLRASFDKFLDGLAKGKDRDALKSAEAKRNDANREAGRVAIESYHADVLASAGVTNQDQLSKLVANRDTIQKVAASFEREKSLDQVGNTGLTADNIIEMYSQRARSGLSVGAKEMSSVIVQSSKNLDGLTGGQRNAIAQSLESYLRFNIAMNHGLQRSFKSPEMGQDSAKQLLNFYHDELKVVGQNAKSEEVKSRNADIKKSTLTDQVVDYFQNGGDLKKLNEAMSAFGDGRPLGEHGKRLEDNKKALEDLTKEIATLREKLGMGPEPTGGWLGRWSPLPSPPTPPTLESPPPEPLPRPNGAAALGRGTDRVPVMASPGEFIVPAAAAAENREFLAAITRGEKPEYFADGGMVGALDLPLPAGDKDIFGDGFGLEEAEKAAAQRRLRARALAALGARMADLRPGGFAAGALAGPGPAGLRRLIRGEQRGFNLAAVAADAAAGDDTGRFAATAANLNAFRLSADRSSDIAGRMTDARVAARPARLAQFAQREQAAHDLSEAQFSARRDAIARWGLGGRGPVARGPRWWQQGGSGVPPIPLTDGWGLPPGGLPARPDQPIQRFAEGGVVRGGGTNDSVRALLSPGERVLTRRDQAEAAGRAATGGEALERALAEHARKLGDFAGATNSFAAHVDKFAAAVSAIPHEIKMDANVRHDVNVTGLEGLQDLEGAFRDMVEKAVHDAIDQRVPGAVSRHDRS